MNSRLTRTGLVFAAGLAALSSGCSNGPLDPGAGREDPPSFVAEWGASTDGAFRELIDAEVAADGTIYVLEDGEFQVFNADGSFRSRSARPEVFYGFEIDRSHSRLILHNSATIRLYDFEGDYQATWTLNREDGSAVRISDLSVDEQGFTYVLDRSRFTIYRLSPEGTVLTSWGEQGVDDGEFEYPSRIDAARGSVSVLDHVRNNIQVFDETGHFERAIDLRNVPEGSTYREIAGIVTGSGGDFWVLERYSRQVIHLSDSGAILTVWKALPDEAYGNFLALDPAGRLLVATENTIARFDAGGAKVDEIGRAFGERPGDLIDPMDVTVSFDGTVFVLERTGEVETYDAMGRPLATLPRPEDYDFVPEAIAVDGQGRLLAVHRGGVTVHERSGALREIPVPDLYDIRSAAFDGEATLYILSRRFDEPGAAVFRVDPDGAVGEPWPIEAPIEFPSFSRIAVSGDRVWIVDEGEAIHRFTTDGRYVDRMAVPSRGAGRFGEPVCIAFDFDDNVYIGDANHGLIYKFSPLGGYVTRWGGTASSRPIGYPSALAFDANGNCFVVDARNDRVLQFRL